MGLHAHTQGNPVTEHMVPTAWSHWPFPSWEAWSRGLGAAGIRKGYPHRGAEGLQGEGARLSAYREGPFTPDQEDE